jgi:hypothetical protein
MRAVKSCAGRVDPCAECTWYVYVRNAPRPARTHRDDVSTVLPFLILTMASAAVGYPAYLSTTKNVVPAMMDGQLAA